MSKQGDTVELVLDCNGGKLSLHLPTSQRHQIIIPIPETSCEFMGGERQNTYCGNCMIPLIKRVAIRQVKSVYDDMCDTLVKD